MKRSLRSRVESVFFGILTDGAMCQLSGDEAAAPGPRVFNVKGLMLAFYTTCYAAYIVLGGLCFLLIEGPEEDARRVGVMAARAKLIQKHPCVTEESLDELFLDVVPVNHRGLHLLNSTSTNMWTFSQAIFFSVTLVTTVGYGHIAPVSQMGKAFCMLYTGLGIPFTLLLLATYVQRLMSVADSLRRGLSCCFGRSVRPFTIRLIQVVIITLTIVVVFFIVPALFFSWLEDRWTYLDALYFCFISLTTVGLGDFVPAEAPFQNYEALYRLAVTGYILLGVTSMMFFMSLITELPLSTEYQEQDSEKIPITADMENYGTLQHEDVENQSWQHSNVHR